MVWSRPLGIGGCAALAAASGGTFWRGFGRIFRFPLRAGRGTRLLVKPSVTPYLAGTGCSGRCCRIGIALLGIACWQFTEQSIHACFAGGSCCPCPLCTDRGVWFSCQQPCRQCRALYLRGSVTRYILGTVHECWFATPYRPVVPGVVIPDGTTCR